VSPPSLATSNRISAHRTVSAQVRLRQLGQLAVLALSYFLLAQLSRLVTLHELGVCPVWLPAGIALAAVLLRGPAMLPGVAIGALADDLARFTPLAAALGIAAAVTVAAAAGALLLRRLDSFDPALDRPRHVVSLIGVGATVAPFVAAAGGVCALVAARIVPATEALPAAALWASGDALGVLLLTTLVLAWKGRRADSAAASASRLPWLLCALQVLVVAGIFLLPPARLGTAAAALITLPLAAILSVLLPLRGVAVMNCALCAASTGATIFGTGPFTGASPGENLAGLSIYNLVVCSTTLVVAALALERQRIADELTGSLERFRGLTALSADWYWEQDEHLRFTYFSPAVSPRFGVDPTTALGRTRFELPVEWQSEQARQQHMRDLDQRLPFHELLLKRTGDAGEPRYFRVSGEPVFGRGGRFRGYRGVTHDVTEVTLGAEALRASEMRFRSLVKLSNDWFWEQDETFRFTRMEGSADHQYVPRFEAFIGKYRWDFPWANMTEEDWAAHKRLLTAHRSFRDMELIGPDNAGQPFHILVSGEPVFDAHGRFRGYRGTSRDITAMRRAERRTQRLSDLYATLSEANQAIIHSDSPERLYQEICRLAIEYGHFVFCRITIIDADSGTLETAAQAGEDRSGLARLRVSLDPSLPEGQGPASDVLRSGVPVVINDIRIDARVELYRPALQESGVRSIATFPLRRGDYVVGALHLYAGPVDFFEDDLVALLGKLVANISFALDNFARDSARAAAEHALRGSETRFRDFTEAAAEFVWETDLQGFVTFSSSRVETISGYRQRELIGHRPQEFMPPGEAERVHEWLAAHRQADGSFRDLEYRVVSRSGEVRWLLLNGVAILDENGQRVGWRGTGADITDRRAAEDRITYLATRDPLTELPNRVLLADRLAQGIAAAQRNQRSIALLFIDLDRFKNINDSLGHEVGDLVLKGAAARLVACVRQGDTLARIGGDEFVMVLEGLRHAEDAAQVAAKILSALSQPFEVAGHSLITSCSIGISIFPDDAPDERTLMKNADIAMYHAKERGRNDYQFFSPGMNERAVERLNLETALRLALEREEFVLHYQPQVDIRTGGIVGVEALIRWQHPAWGMLAPGKFIGVAEETGLIESLGEWTLLTACQQARAWQLAGLPQIKIAVNISARQLLRPQEFCRKVMSVIELAGIDPALVELEMTESLLLQNADDNISALSELGKRHVRVAVDDFGTGYSSLSYLKQLPIDTLKIDRSFTNNLPDDHEGVVIVQAIVAMAHSLGLRVTAEGVETQEQLAMLRDMRCDEYQGFLFSKPIAAAQMTELLRAQTMPVQMKR
jgi:diguanylate cyclase (GGDEF)-like protein/PAS domain S-box-containing protein